MMPATRTIAALARDRCRNPQGRRNVKKRKTNLPKSASYTKEMGSQRTTDRRRGVADLGQAAALQYQNPTLMENWIERAGSWLVIPTKGAPKPGPRLPRCRRCRC